jgi:hypothetical protein
MCPCEALVYPKSLLSAPPTSPFQVLNHLQWRRRRENVRVANKAPNVVQYPSWLIMPAHKDNTKFTYSKPNTIIQPCPCCTSGEETLTINPIQYIVTCVCQKKKKGKKCTAARLRRNATNCSCHLIRNLSTADYNVRLCMTLPQHNTPGIPLGIFYLLSLNFETIIPTTTRTMTRKRYKIYNIRRLFALPKPRVLSIYPSFPSSFLPHTVRRVASVLLLLHSFRLFSSFLFPRTQPRCVSHKSRFPSRWSRRSESLPVPFPGTTTNAALHSR